MIVDKHSEEHGAAVYATVKITRTLCRGMVRGSAASSVHTYSQFVIMLYLELLQLPLMLIRVIWLAPLLRLQIECRQWV